MFRRVWRAMKKATGMAPVRGRGGEEEAKAEEEKSDLPDGVVGRGGTPVWQRRILMGERCELPRFSGLILYDEHGRLVACSSGRDHCHNLKGPARGVTTLKDLL
ncbi:hypothetical protein ZIOFF_031770 [Zingiber officinale]|uniref:Uncharacterized protein n=1 Tax=Zingiber officinale TaxID=94328 RepID=A0A8J5GFC3_ZINOF|nr:hypothetical protein ZIOFF_031770 [Zingiber officinale]